jgi:phosphate starvation-inducible protein PhoH and related proteins
LSRKRSDRRQNRRERSDSKSFKPRSTNKSPFQEGCIKPIYARTVGQEEFIDTVKAKELTLVNGLAGTGKSFISFGMAIHYRLTDPNIKRIVIVRPVIPSGSDDLIGFLPGDINEKLRPFTAPLFKDSAYQLFDFGEELSSLEYESMLQNFLLSLDIEVIPLSMLRGRSLANAFIILDESQNCNYEDFRLFLTRIGENSKVIIEGDSSQPDRDDSGFLEIIEKLRGLPEAGVVKLTEADIVRNPLIVKILERLD